MLKNLATTALTLACLSTAVQASPACPQLSLDDVNTLLKNKAIEIPQGDLITKWKLILDSSNRTDAQYGLLLGGQFDPDQQLRVLNKASQNDNQCVYDVIMFPKSLVDTVRTIGRFRITE
jgi:hypothetical protein